MRIKNNLLIGFKFARLTGRVITFLFVAVGGYRNEVEEAIGELSRLVCNNRVGIVFECVFNQFTIQVHDTKKMQSCV